MVGAANALDQSADAFGCTNLDHEIDIAPINAKVQAGGCHHGTQPTGSHGLFDFLALLRLQAAVMHANG